ncbi:heat shock protein GrpE [Gemmata obscuriglobus]|uniref:Protein GrpE n=1 Tax=Gemmata obscuriglobus TaxID=114 RepID=A0A2Z3GVA5_9BACT|nr:nucleotide exchange factor GrpE [Gemmata obscuriglobus]AWM35992.1 nucleotide exchange factor GrpE [Gemmata obscuriglobus]QEG31439.1 heat shock protein GrpE [Gemmata obscuriglobus]VTS10781.1 co-chaperone : Protein GrpE OS=Planctomyces maris DSM 8797 GN=grpE PE=3 SV=1: GrpE [Gemmata obscuriglobus UQM 2246]
MADETPADATTEPTPAADAAELVAVRARLEASEAELSNYKLKLADFENTRKRLLRDAETDRKYAAEGVMRDLLPALDNLDRAVEAAKRAGDTGPLAVGVAATYTQFLDALKRHGVLRIVCEPGSPFDPNKHEAVMKQPGTEFPPDSVVQVLQHGFTLHERVLRPTTVMVASE